jgi:uncharacterized RDD family membrane protein YckC
MAGVKTKQLLGHYAGFGSRFLAHVIDIGIIALLLYLLATFFEGLPTLIELGTGIPSEWLEQMTGWLPTGVGRTVLALQLSSLVSVTVMLGYHIFFVFVAGRTPGKALMGVRVLRTDGSRPTIWQTILRTLGYIVSGLPLLLGFFWVLIDDQRQALHDKLARTYVVYGWEARPDEHFLAQQIERLATKPESSDNA